MLLEDGKRDDIEHALVARSQHDRRRDAVHVRTQPVHRGHAPTVARYQSRKTVVRHRRGEIVADPLLMFEELSGHHRAHCVAAEVVCSGPARTVAVETCQRIQAASLEVRTQNVPISHRLSIVAIEQFRPSMPHGSIERTGEPLTATKAAGVALYIEWVLARRSTLT